MTDPVKGYNRVKSSQDREKFLKTFGPSRILLEKLDIFSELLLRWQTKTNLIGNSTINIIWERHFLDSAQLYLQIDRNKKTLVDLGSGAGFPGLVLAVMFLEFGGPKVHLIESNKRKTVFLTEASQLLGVDIKIHNARIESILNLKGDFITARALAPLNRLVSLSQRFLSSDTICLFLKGKKFKEELGQARKYWRMRVEEISSITSPNSRILKISEIYPVA